MARHHGLRLGPTLTKLESATTLAGALGYLLVRQQDATGLTVVTGQEFERCRRAPRPSHLNVCSTRSSAPQAQGHHRPVGRGRPTSPRTRRGAA